MKLIPYWIQRADFSSTDYGPVEVADGVRAFEGHDWRRELDHYSELESSGVECCPPGIGFVDSAGDILHICPTGKGRAMVHYHFASTRRLLGFIPVPRLIVETRQDMTRSEVLELIGYFFEGRHDWMLQTLGRRPQPFSRFWAASGITAQAAILLAAVSGAIYIATFAPLELDEPPRLLYLPHLAVMMLLFACFVRTFMRLFDSKLRSINVFAVKMPRSIAIAAVVALICFVMSLGHLVVTGEPVRGVVSLRVFSSAWAIFSLVVALWGAGLHHHASQPSVDTVA